MSNIRPPENILRTIREMDGENDRGVALIGTSLVEHSLVEAIKTKFTRADEVSDIFSDQGPLGTMSAMETLGYALGLFGKAVKYDLKIVRKIRNEFAHDPNAITFNTPNISDRCRSLIISKPSEPHKNGEWRNKFFLEICLLSACLMKISIVQPFLNDDTEKEMAGILSSDDVPD